MNISEYKNIYENEASHFYYAVTRKLVISLVKRCLPTTNYQSPITILDAGCGTGLLAKKLEIFGDVTAVDFSSEAIKFAKKRGLKTVKVSITKLPFPEKTFDLVTSVDVIYHEWVEDDQIALSELYRVIKPGGILILKVPALKWLTLAHDKYVYTKRRYDKKELENKLKDAGFKIEKLSYINLILLNTAVVKLFWEKVHPTTRLESNITKLPSLINRIGEIILRLEYKIAMAVNFPIGMGLIAVARKT